MNKTFLTFIAWLLLLSACVSEPEVVATSALKVDLNEVVAAGVVKPVGGMTAAGQPDEASLKVFADSGYAAVIDLRTAGEDRGIDEPAVVKRLGMKYVSLPIGRNDIQFEKAEMLDELISRYDGPVLVHCGSSNRVGALLALRASLDGADDESAIATGRDGGLASLEGEVREVLGSM
ncbi:MAG: hypothetical protein ACR2QZ_10010 [Woeseiaceae bacterium]